MSGSDNLPTIVTVWAATQVCNDGGPRPPEKRFPWLDAFLCCIIVGLFALTAWVIMSGR